MSSPSIKILFLAFIICILTATTCSGQVAYSRVVPYDPRYMIRRVPVRRSAEFEPRLRLPLNRYFPQVDTQLASAAYYPPEAAPAYRLANGEVYAVPSKWADDVVPLSTLERNDDNDYDAYDYDNGFNPTYARVYPSDVVDRDVDGDLDNDVMVNYLLSEMQPSVDESEYQGIQRRSELLPVQYAMDNNNNEEVDISKKNANSTTVSSSTRKPATSSSSAPASVSTTPASAKVSVAPTRKVIQKQQPNSRSGNDNYMMPPRDMALQRDVFRYYNGNNRGQKEIPLYREVHQSPMASLESQMSRAKNTPQNKDALPIIEKLMSVAHQSKDPLKEQLDNLKFRSM